MSGEDGEKINKNAVSAFTSSSARGTIYSSPWCEGGIHNPKIDPIQHFNTQDEGAPKSRMVLPVVKAPICNFKLILHLEIQIRIELLSPSRVEVYFAGMRN